MKRTGKSLLGDGAQARPPILGPFSTSNVSTIRRKASPGCGGLLTDVANRFLNYNGSRSLCIWAILMKPNQQVVLAFPSLSLTCVNEWIEVFDGPLGSNTFGKICQGFSLVFRSTFNIMTVKYTRNSTNPSSFFSAYYYGDPTEVIRPPVKTRGPDECGGLPKEHSGSLALSLRSRAVCVWALQVKRSQNVLLAFPAHNHSCARGQMEDLNGPQGSFSLGKFCQGISLLFQWPSYTMSNNYSRNSVQHPTLFDAYHYGDSKVTSPAPAFARLLQAIKSGKQYRFSGDISGAIISGIKRKGP
ncbi:CUB domain-containing protein isoform X2 [Tamandua tetradactyla]|uniref:CUB domain-containing protein isoform X2 n=1 Tax=Tamandua tetradactyla TaxID=48850 RepID=UPI004053989E